MKFENPVKYIDINFNKINIYESKFFGLFYIVSLNNQKKEIWSFIKLNKLLKNSRYWRKIE